MQPPVSALELVDIEKRFGRQHGLTIAGISLAAPPGELLALLGPSGCGKSTTLRIIAGFEAPDAGRVLLDGADVTATPPNRRGVGMVFQSYALFPNLTAFENVAFGLRLRRRPGAEVQRRAGELLELCRLGDLGGRLPAQLSGGQQQRVALARALAIEPKVLLLDEPLAALDAVIRTELRAEIRRIQRRLGMTTVYVTHDQEEALSLADRIAVLRAGRIEQLGPPSAIYHAPRTAFVASFVGKLNVLAAEVEDPATGVVRAAGARLELGRPLEAAAGARVSVAMRPESLVPADAGGAGNRLTGVCREVEFLGAVVLWHLEVAGAHLTVQRLNTPGVALPRAGETVTVAVDREACLVFPA
ncbi:MAG TPA: ABC transporter ATP-binding protein [Polyangia bacterium]|jgi:putative spermidine/putrescine transport system ATP-binding protein